MSDTPVRLVGLRRIANVACAVGVLAGLAIMALAAWQTWWLWGAGELAASVLLPGFVGLSGLLVVAASVAARALASVLLKVEANTFRSHDVLLDARDLLSAQQARLDEIAENVQLSDAAKSIARREKERDALREAIQEEILRGNWDAAYYLVDELERRFGYAAEASRLREDVDRWQSQAREQRLEQALEQIDEALERFEWQRARALAERVQKAFPGNERVQHLDERIQEAFNRRKEALLAEWREAVDRHEVDRSLELLRELDRYLTPEEAQDLREPVRSVFREKLQNLGAQFTMAYKERQWERATQIAEEIIAEFPNSRMAEEVKTLMASIRERAGTESGQG